MVAKKLTISLEEMNKTIAEGLVRSAASPNIWGYRPHDKQISFHSNTKRIRLYTGGNRSGKTVGGVCEDVWYLQGNHPYKRLPWQPPVHGRIIGVDFENGIERILKPQVARWLPPSALINGSWTDSYRAGERMLTLANGSTVEFMSYVQAKDKFAGTSRHFIHFDEEPPQGIYTENWARTVDVGGHMWFTMTPVEGMTWVYDVIFIPGVQGTDDKIGVIQVGMEENPYIGESEREAFLSGLDPLERRARGKGEFVQLGGLVFKHFNPIHVVDPVDPKTLLALRQWGSMDHGLNNPTAWLWHAVYPDGSVLTFDEHYESGWTVSQHASRVHLMNQEHGRPPNFYVGDPAIKQRNAETGHNIQFAYQKEGIPIVLANNEVRAGIDRMNSYMIISDDGHPTWRITSNCINLIHEIARYRWKVWESSKLRDKNNPMEEPHKKNDHAVDSSRYFFSFMPDLALREDGKPDRTAVNARWAAEIGARQGVNAEVGMFDPEWSRPQQPTEWEAVDENVGPW